ncbi:MAG: ABC transporter ATP-binding protein [Weeksellaceae bacterium]
MSKKAYIQATNLTKSFQVRDGEVQVLKGINLSIQAGEFVIIFGPSGCGKSTLLHTLLGLEKPTGGTLEINDISFYGMEEDQRAMYRRYHFGIIYQQPLWIASLNVHENVAFTLHLLDLPESEIKTKVTKQLEMVHMEQWAQYRPTELSSGQQQKISLARAMALDPNILVADEPTGNLDTVSGQELIESFCNLNKAGKTLIMVTHDLEYLRYGTHLVHMVDGQIVEELMHDDIQKLSKIKGKREIGGTLVEDSNVRDPLFLKNMHKP